MKNNKPEYKTEYIVEIFHAEKDEVFSVLEGALEYMRNSIKREYREHMNSQYIYFEDAKSEAGLGIIRISFKLNNDE